MKRIIKILTISGSILGAIATIIKIFYGFYSDLKIERNQLQETLHQRTVNYHETIVYYANELGQTVQEVEICETKQQIIEDKIAENNKIIEDYEEILDEVTSIEILEDQKEEIKTENIQNITSETLSSNLSTNIHQEIKGVKTLKNEPLLMSRKKDKKILGKIIDRIKNRPN